MELEIVRTSFRVNHNDCDTQLTITDLISAFEDLLVKDFDSLKIEMFDDMKFEI